MCEGWVGILLSRWMMKVMFDSQPSLQLKRNRSLLQQVIIWTVVTLLILAVLAGGFAFWNSYRQISNFQNDNLKNIANLIADNENQNLKNKIYNNLAQDSVIEPLSKSQHYQLSNNDDGISIDVFRLVQPAQVSTEKNTLLENHTHTQIQFNKSPLQSDRLTFQQLQHIPNGLSSQQISGEEWRVYRLDKNNAIIIVRQLTDLQADLAESSAIQSLAPLLLAILALGAILPLIMWRMFHPVKVLANTVIQRQDFDFSPLPLTNLPDEILPFMTAINQLLVQVKNNVEQQQRFIADTSHELRSPLTAISLQVQRLQRLATDDTIRAGLDKLALRVKRNQDLVEQLLTLARLNANHDHIQPVAVRPLLEQAVNLLLPIIDNKQIQLVLDINNFSQNTHHQDVTIHADATAILLLIKNIIQNAVLYTPDGGQVSIALKSVENWPDVLKSQSVCVIGASHQTAFDLPAKQTILQIIDTGCGIDQEHYLQAFEPFVRLNSMQDTMVHRSDNLAANQGPKGTGLGLSIVKTVCEQTGILLFLSASQGSDYNLTANRGLCVTLVLPQE